MEKEPFCEEWVFKLYPEQSMEAVVNPTVEKEQQPREVEEEEKWYLEKEPQSREAEEGEKW